ncbi:MAG: lysophospholipid acyltransferase family protein [Candidatus Krumholzibacteriia bacterium]
MSQHREAPGAAGLPPPDPGAGLPVFRRWRRRFYHGLLLAVAAAVAQAPPATGRFLCERLALAALLGRGRERRRAEANLAAAWPSLTAAGAQNGTRSATRPVDEVPGQGGVQEAARRRLVHASARALGRNLHTALRLEELARGDYAGVRPVAGPEGLDAVGRLRELRDEGRGVLLLTGHLGCWELLGAYLARRLGGLAVVTGTVHNPAVDAWLQGSRRRLGLTVLPRDRGVRPVLERLRAGEIVAVLLDQNTRVPSLPVPFLGRPAPTAVGPARLAVRLGSPLLPVAIARCGDAGAAGGSGAGTRTPGDLHEVHCLQTIRPPCTEEQVPDLLAACNSALAEFVRRNPVEWVWFHDRWGEDSGAGPERR